MKSVKIFLNITSVFCFIFGALYCFSLVFIPVGIYCFLAGKRFSYKAEHLFDTISITNKTLKYYTIFVCIVCFPFGLLSIIAYRGLVSNNVKISGFKVVEKEEQNSNDENEDSESSTDNLKNDSVETEEEKKEKFEKLKNFKEKGLITDEELEMARVQLFGKDKDN